MIPALAAAFGASLLGSPHCVGMCGAFSSVHATRSRGAAWHLGRGAAYVTGGAIAGGVGGFAAELGWVGIGLMAAMLVWFAARLAGFTTEGAAGSGTCAGRLQAKVVSWSTRLLRQGGVPAAAAFGALTALLRGLAGIPGRRRCFQWAAHATASRQAAALPRVQRPAGTGLAPV